MLTSDIKWNFTKVRLFLMIAPQRGKRGDLLLWRKAGRALVDVTLTRSGFCPCPCSRVHRLPSPLPLPFLVDREGKVVKRYGRCVVAQLGKACLSSSATRHACAVHLQLLACCPIACLPAARRSVLTHGSLLLNACPAPGSPAPTSKRPALLPVPLPAAPPPPWPLRTTSSRCCEPAALRSHDSCNDMYNAVLLPSPSIEYDFLP